MNTITSETYNFIKSYPNRVPISPKVKKAFRMLRRDVNASWKDPMCMQPARFDKMITYSVFWTECISMETGLKHIITTFKPEFTEEGLSELITHLWVLSLWMNDQPEARGNLTTFKHPSYWP